MKITVVEFDSKGGLIHYAYQLCTAMQRSGIETTLITGTDYELEEFPHNFSVDKRLHLWPRHSKVFDHRAAKTILGKSYGKITRIFRRAVRALKLVNAWFLLTNHLIRQKPDIVQFSEIHFFFEGIFLRRLRNRGLHLSQICHEFEHRETKGLLKPLITYLNTSIFTNFSSIFFLSQHIRDAFLQTYSYPPANTHIIPHGNESIFLRNTATLKCKENLKKKYNLASSENVVLFFGTLVPSKGLQDLIAAFALLPDNVNAKLVIAGFPSKHVDPETFKQQVVSLQLSNRVIFDLRYIPTECIGSLMELATVVAFPYHSSTQSGAIQVAYTFGRPVIATAVGGLKEVVEDSKSGYLVPPHRPDRIAEKLSLMLHSPETTRKMGLYARDISETRFNWQPIAETISEVYEKGLKRSGTG